MLLPGLINALSNISGRFVAATKRTFFEDSTPIIKNKIKKIKNKKIK